MLNYANGTYLNSRNVLYEMIRSWHTWHWLPSITTPSFTYVDIILTSSNPWIPSQGIPRLGRTKHWHKALNGLYEMVPRGHPYHSVPWITTPFGPLKISSILSTPTQIFECLHDKGPNLDAKSFLWNLSILSIRRLYHDIHTIQSHGWPLHCVPQKFRWSHRYP